MSCAAGSSTTSTGFREPTSPAASAISTLALYERHRALLDDLPTTLAEEETAAAVVNRSGDPQLERLCCEYLPITFGRRHGDPSRPWNRFSIRLKDARGAPLLSYEGNWRDIFQNWEALRFSFPASSSTIIAKFVNASTVDGYNPYRITPRRHRLGSRGSGRSVEPHRLLGRPPDHLPAEAPGALAAVSPGPPRRQLLHRPIFSYANVPYRIRTLRGPRRGPEANRRLRPRSSQRGSPSASRRIGADGKLVLDPTATVLPGQPAREAARAPAGQALATSSSTAASG